MSVCNESVYNANECNVVTDVSRDECGVMPPVNENNLVTWLRDVFHVTRSPIDETNKKDVRRFIIEHLGNISAAVDKAAVEEQRFSVPGQVMVLSPKAV